MVDTMTNWDDNQPATTCKGCHKKSDGFVHPITDHYWARNDCNGFFTGIYCDKCYNSNDSDLYPYRKDNYNQDAIENGEDIWGEDDF
tara:strand:- start:1000 stop:1260 length:261 start_codon:yes stop_codon:yes gene_type:complete